MNSRGRGETVSRSSPLAIDRQLEPGVIDAALRVERDSAERSWLAGRCAEGAVLPDVGVAGASGTFNMEGIGAAHAFVGMGERLQRDHAAFLRSRILQRTGPRDSGGHGRQRAGRD
ncbi:hypothetical protein NKH57_32810 [Mesorhizobium sp. M1050]